MSEAVKTTVFAVGALLLAGIAYITQPTQEVVRAPDQIGQPLFAEFDNPDQAASLEIVRYQEDLGEIHDFKVAKNSRTQGWEIPSHAQYPADAEEQMRDAALSLVGLRVLDIATEEPGEHEMYGVIEPNKEDTKLGDQGVGVMVSFEDDKGKDLARLIIGKAVRDAEAQRFVRIPQQDVVYVVEIDPEKLSTKFEDWIEEDLLQLNSFDVERLTMKDYSIVETTAGPRLELRSDAAVRWNSTDSEWELERLVAYRGSEGTPTELLETEELDTQKLNDAKNALDDLKIVDVRRKPKGLGANLQADESFMDDAANRRDLLALGFYPNRTPNGYELLSANGEIHALMKDGYEYILRFGGVAGTADDDGGLKRYLFVTTRVNEDHIPEPELEDLPADDASGDENTTPAPADSQNGGEEAAPETATGDASTDEAAVDGDSGTQQPNDGEEDADDERKRKLVAERERITKENQRKLDEYQEKKKTAQTKVNELNTRFADWYYVISEDVYRKIHLSRTDIIKEKEGAADEGFDVESFRQLQTEGLNKETD